GERGADVGRDDAALAGDVHLRRGGPAGRGGPVAAGHGHGDDPVRLRRPERVGRPGRRQRGAGAAVVRGRGGPAAGAGGGGGRQPLRLRGQRPDQRGGPDGAVLRGGPVERGGGRAGEDGGGRLGPGTPRRHSRPGPDHDLQPGRPGGGRRLQRRGGGVKG